MILHNAIHACDSTPLYLDFWPIVSKIWKLKFNVTPVLAYIGDQSKSLIDTTYGKVVYFKPIKDIPIYLQAQWARFWLAGQENGNSIITDIDMLPLSRAYFLDQISTLNNDSYIHINPCIESYGRLPACYHIANADSFKEVLSLHSTWEESIKYLYSLNLGNDPGGHLTGKTSWYAEEIFTSHKVLNFSNQQRIKLLPRSNGQNGFRIDRINFGFDLNKLFQDFYYDFHSLRPYTQYKKYIDLIQYITLFKYT